MGAKIEVVVGRYAGQCQGGWSHVRRCQSTNCVGGEDTDTRSHRLPDAQL